MRAIVHRPSPHMQSCQLTYLDREPIDVLAAEEQHRGYCDALRALDVEVDVLDVSREHPDCAFVEDTAVVVDELAVVTPMGTGARAREPAAIAAHLERYRTIARVELPARLEGGDVLRVDRQLWVGRSPRTDGAGIAALAALLEPHGYRVCGVAVTGCLHLKTGCTALPDGRFLVNPAWVDVDDLPASEIVAVPQSEPFGANILPVNGSILVPAAHVRVAQLLGDLGFAVVPVDISEFARAEAGVTCLSIVLDD